MRNILGRYLWR